MTVEQRDWEFGFLIEGHLCQYQHQTEEAGPMEASRHSDGECLVGSVSPVSSFGL